MTGEVDLDPGVSVGPAHQVGAAEAILLAAQVAGDEARRNVQRAGQHHHRSGEVLAVTGHLTEQERDQRIVEPAVLHVEAVLALGGQPLFERPDRIEPRVRSGGDLSRKLRDP